MMFLFSFPVILILGVILISMNVGSRFLECQLRIQMILGRSTTTTDVMNEEEGDKKHICDLNLCVVIEFSLDKIDIILTIILKVLKCQRGRERVMGRVMGRVLP